MKLNSLIMLCLSAGAISYPLALQAREIGKPAQPAIGQEKTDEIKTPAAGSDTDSDTQDGSDTDESQPDTAQGVSKDSKDGKQEEKADAVSDTAMQKGFAGSYLSGLFARSNGDVNDGIAYLRKAHEDDPDNLDVMSQLQGLLLIDGKVDEAVDLADKIHSYNKKDPVSDLLLALRDIRSGNSKAASLILDGTFDAGGGQLWQPLVSAWLDLDRGKLKQALKLESLTVNVGRAAPLVYYHLALINNKAGFKQEAAIDFKNAIEDPQNPPSHIMEALLSFYEQNNQPAVLTPLVSAYRSSNPESPLKENAVLPASMQDGVAEVLFTMGSVMLEADVGQDATIYLRLALYLKPDFSIAALTLADAYGDLRQFDRANEIYLSVAPTSRLYIPAQLHLALNYDRMGKTNDALALLDHLSREMPDRYEALLAKGDMLREHKRYGDAVSTYSQAISRVTQLEPYHWPLLFARGASYEEMGRWDLAEHDMKQALALNPDQPELLNYLGYSWLTRHEHIDEARAMLEKAIRARPDDAQIVDSMGWAMYLTGEYDEAEAYLEKAVELLPSDPTLNDHLGDIYWRQGRKTEARYQWERSLTFSPEQAEASAIHKKLKDGLPPAPENVKKSAAATSSPLVASRLQPVPTP